MIKKNQALSLFLLFFIPLIFSKLHPLSFTHSDRQIHYPYFHGDAIRSIANFVYDKNIEEINPLDVKLGDTIFVRGDLLDDFFL